MNTEPPTVTYGEDYRAVFARVCPKCGRFVKPDPTMRFNGFGEVKPEANATCKKCGRVEMPFEGYY